MDALSAARATSPQPTAPARPSQADAAAHQFEEVLVKQFVQTMTKELFEPMEGGPGWMGSQADLQREALADVLTSHLVESGALRVGDLVRRQWSPEVTPTEKAPLPIDAPIPARTFDALPARPIRPPSTSPLDLSA